MKPSKNVRELLQHDLDTLELTNFNNGFESCIEYVEQIADRFWNEGRFRRAEILRELAKELRGEE